MRILLCKGQLDGPISGSDEILVTYASHLKKMGNRVSVLLMYLHAEEDQYYQRLLEAGVPVAWIASNLAHRSMSTGRKLAYKLFNAFPWSQKFLRQRTLKVVIGLARRHYRRCREYIKSQDPDVIHVMTPDPSAMIMIQAAHEAGVPILYQELGMPYHPPTFESNYRQFTSAIPLCAEVAALSPKLREDCREKLPPARAFSVIPIISNQPINGSKPRLSPDRVTFGFAARMEELKGTMILMDAFALAFKECKSIVLNIAGDGSKRREFATRVKAMDLARNYRYHGVYTHPEDGRNFMESLDVFVMPSLSEGTPNAIVEAMACGKPVIASDVGGIPDMIGDDAGILVPPGDAQALADAMVRMATDPELRKRMGEAAQRRCDRLFSPRTVVPLMMATYRRVKRGGKHSTELIDDNGTLHPWALDTNAGNRFLHEQEEPN